MNNEPARGITIPLMLAAVCVVALGCGSNPASDASPDAGPGTDAQPGTDAGGGSDAGSGTDGASPPSVPITGVSFDFAGTLVSGLAPGSDNWPITWAADGHQYTAWGDGGGFGGTNTNGRVSLGFGRVEGSASAYTGFNVFGGVNPEGPSTPPIDGKSYGLLALDGTLYMWVSPGSGAMGYTSATLYTSTDDGGAWTANGWSFTGNSGDGLIFPTILQAGQNHSDARDGYVYMYANHYQPGPALLRVHTPGEVALLRVPTGSILDRATYEFYAGPAGGVASPGDAPTWTTDVSARTPVFTDPNGVGWNCSAIYNVGLGRYLLVTEHDASMEGRIGIHEAPEPWGPWTTVHYADSFGVPMVEDVTFFWSFSPKWMSSDGLGFVLVFTGVNSTDDWQTVAGTFIVN